MFVGGGLQKLGGKVIRVGHLGSSANEVLMNRLLAAIEAALKTARA